MEVGFSYGLLTGTGRTLEGFLKSCRSISHFQMGDYGFFIFLIIGFLILWLLWIFCAPAEITPDNLKVNSKVKAEVIHPAPREEDPSRPEVKTPNAVGNKYLDCVAFDGGKPSLGERVCKNYLESRFGVPFKHCRPLFLKNPDTGHNLELDLYSPELRLAVEYQGILHYRYPNWRHDTPAQFAKQIKHDRFKKAMCERVGVYLICVPCHEVGLPTKDIPNYIEDRLPERLKNWILPDRGDYRSPSTIIDSDPRDAS